MGVECLCKTPELFVNLVQKQGDMKYNILIDSLMKLYTQKLLEAGKGKVILEPIKQKKRFYEFKKMTTDKKQYEKYITCLNEALEGNSGLATNVLKLMLEEVGDESELKRLSPGFNKDEQYAALKCFIYLYTCSYTSKKSSQNHYSMNNMLRKNEYNKISSIIGVVIEQLEKYSNKQYKFTRTMKPSKKEYSKRLVLYHRTAKQDKKIRFNQTYFWKQFKNASIIDKKEEKSGNYLFIIQLDDQNPHKYIVVPKQLNQNQKEEVLLFPYFFFLCTEFKQNANTYYVKQIQPLSNSIGSPSK